MSREMDRRAFINIVAGAAGGTALNGGSPKIAAA
jgi:hypothetical protein